MIGVLRYGEAGRLGDCQTDVDIALIGRVGARDERALSELYDRHSRLLYGLVLRILHDRGHAEDVLQEVFLALWTRVHTYNVALGAPVAWLVRIARNRAIDRLRASGVRLRAVESAPADCVDSTSPEDSASAGERWRAASRVLGALPREQRVLIEDAYFLGLTHAELAAQHGLPLGTVKTRIRTGMQTLRQSLTAVSTDP
jgi:RNA polymerase sigma-70 factor (ECF subfamily)